MPAARKHIKDEFPETFMPTVAHAADLAAEEVLAEDHALRMMAIEFLGLGRAA